MSKLSEADHQEAIDRLLTLINPGDTVYMVLRHVSRSGMQRVIDVQLIREGAPYWIGGAVAKALGYRYHRDRNGLVVDGCGMDMGFSVVYNLSATLFPNGFGCIGEKCHSNDHFNGDSDRRPHSEGCQCQTCAVCGGLTICWVCQMCTRCHEHREGCRGCEAEPGEPAHKHWHRAGGYAFRHQWI